MGSWNATCGVTRLPIFAGDPVVGFLLTERPPKSGDGRGFCYSNGLWTPRSPHFFGTYDDYGGFEDVMFPAWLKNVIERDFRETLATNPKVALRRETFDPKTFSLDNPDQLFEHIRSDRLAVESFRAVGYNVKTGDVKYSKKPTLLRIGYMMVHRFAFDHMITQPVELLDGTTDYRADLLKRVEKVVEDVRKKISKMLPILNKQLEGTDLGSLTKEEAINYVVSGAYGNAFVETGIIPHNYPMPQYLGAFTDAIIEDDQTRLDEVIEYMATFCHFVTVFELMRMSWAPQGGASQMDELHYYRSMNETVNQWIAARDRTYEGA